ncbi:MAG: metallophosphoesterase family protein [Phycisphaerae bacterium]|nr:metallophosphoesterase family protein [Phycisphaerae bacterium]
MMITLRIHLVCLLTLLGAAACGAQPTSQPNMGPLDIGPYLLAADSRSMTVCWATSRPSTGFVEFGETAKYGRRAEAREELSRQKVALDKLEPGRVYHYRVVTPGGATDDLTFRALPGPGQPITFVADGDQRGSNRYQRHLAAYRKISPALVVSLGDICNDNGTDYDAILLMDRGLWSGVPWYPVFGNHDAAGEARDGRWAMWDVFAVPAPKFDPPLARLFYSFDAGGCHFAAIDEQLWMEQERKKEWDVQRAWLAKDLKAARANRDTRFVFTLRHDADRMLFDIKAGDPLLEDIYFFGGIHNYFRGQAKNGLVVIQSSGGGVDHLREVPEGDWVKAGKSCFNYVRVDVKGDKLKLRAFDLGQPDGEAPAKVEGDLLDTFEMTSRAEKKGR